MKWLYLVYSRIKFLMLLVCDFFSQCLRRLFAISRVIFGREAPKVTKAAAVCDVSHRFFFAFTSPSSLELTVALAVSSRMLSIQRVLSQCLLRPASDLEFPGFR